METAVVIMGAVITAMCALWTARAVRRRKEKQKAVKDECREHEQLHRATAREAYYMNNFWKYDGSEQADWDEEE